MGDMPRLPIGFANYVFGWVLVASAATGVAAPVSQPADVPPATLPAATSSATSRPATGPSLPSAAVEKKVTELTRRAVRLIEKSQLDAAQAVLAEALELDPTHTTNLYNSACLFALKGDADRAIDFLERAAEAGWADFVHLGRDPDLKSLRDLPRYKALIARKDEYQKRAAMSALAALKAQFGDSYLYELDEQKKLIFATNIDAETLTELKNWLTAQATSQWAELFEHKPDQFVSVVIPSPADYRKIVKMPNVAGFYNDTAKLLIAQRLGQTVTHEFTHALHAADRAPLGQDHPIWIAEGLASLYEAGRFEGDRLVPGDNHRHNVLLAAAATNRLIPMDKLLSMEQPEFVRRASMAYGQAASVMRYLYDQKQLRPFYEAYKASFEKDPTGRQAIEKVTGKSLAEFEKAWKAWLVAKPRVPTSSGVDGAVIGARLGDAVDGLAVEEVVAGGPADKAGLKSGDLIVGLGDARLVGGFAQVRDYESFVPMIIQFKPGDEVRLRLRRGGKYMELPVTLARRSELAEPKK
jgi:tetratricopeptide (TPR) repeat protein